VLRRTYELPFRAHGKLRVLIAVEKSDKAAVEGRVADCVSGITFEVADI
jgi:hypothetical protein